MARKIRVLKYLNDERTQRIIATKNPKGFGHIRIYQEKNNGELFLVC